MIGASAPWPVAWTRTRQPVLAGEAHGLGDVVFGRDGDHDVRVVADGRVEAGDLGGEALVAADVDGAGDGVAQARDAIRVEFDSHGAKCRGGHRHAGSPAAPSVDRQAA